MRFWDASAIVPLLVREATTAWARDHYAADPGLVVWYLSAVEAWSAVNRRRRDGVLGSPDLREARRRLQLLTTDWTEIDDQVAVRRRALRLLEVHALRAADALQLAAALVLVADRPDGFPFVTLDERLGECAEREGFDVIAAAESTG